MRHRGPREAEGQEFLRPSWWRSTDLSNSRSGKYSRDAVNASMPGGAREATSQPRFCRLSQGERRQVGSDAHERTPEKFVRAGVASSTQKEYLRLNCRILGSCALVIWPKRLELKLVVGFPKLTRFSALKNSARNSSLWRSENGIGNALKIEKSRSA
jgi:hypothetical protein